MSSNPTAATPHATDRKIHLVIEFDGTDFAGWQVQPEPSRTVQGVIQDALARLPGQHGPVLAAGRTDSGVHALAMSAHVRTTTPIKAVRLAAAINSQLPRDVRILRAEPAAGDFEAQFSCQYRRYLYRLRESSVPLIARALDRHRVLTVAGPIDWSAMQAAANQLVGTKNFASFATQETRSTVRTVHLAAFESRGAEMWFHIAADGFLRGMVRTVLGTLLDVGRGRRDWTSIAALLAAEDRRLAGATQAAHGLYFVEAGYQPWDRAVSDQTFERTAPLPRVP